MVDEPVIVPEETPSVSETMSLGESDNSTSTTTIIAAIAVVFSIIALLLMVFTILKYRRREKDRALGTSNSTEPIGTAPTLFASMRKKAKSFSIINPPVKKPSINNSFKEKDEELKLPNLIADVEPISSSSSSSGTHPYQCTEHVDTDVAISIPSTVAFPSDQNSLQKSRTNSTSYPKSMEYAHHRSGTFGGTLSRTSSALSRQASMRNIETSSRNHSRKQSRISNPDLLRVPSIKKGILKPTRIVTRSNSMVSRLGFVYF